MNKRWLTALVGAAALAGGLMIGTQHGIVPSTTPYPLAGQTFESPSGGTLDLGALKGKIVVLNFWGTWCPPCVEEMPELNALYPELQGKGIELIGLAIDSPSNVREFLQKTPVNYPILLAGLNGSELAKRLGNSQGGLPYTVILDGNGQQILAKAGRIHMDEIKSAIRQ